MKQTLAKLLSALALSSALVLGAALLGLIPPKDPAGATKQALDVRKAVERTDARPTDQPPSKAPASIPLWTFSLCDAPARGARLYRIALTPHDDAYLVWCKGGYLLVDLKLGIDAPSATRLARFDAKGELPGGAAMGDLDGDGERDLLLGVAPGPEVVHRPGAGLYWVRGRKQGGFDAPRALIEAPTVALAVLDLDGNAASELAVLTRGDLPAQRPGELWVFAGGSAPSRVGVFPLGLDPRDLALTPGAESGATYAWVVLGQPGSVVRLSLAASSLTGVAPQRVSTPISGAQSFVSQRGTESTLFVRDATDVRELERGPALTSKIWAERAHVGPAAVVDLDGDGKPELLASFATGFAWLDDDTHAPNERELPAPAHVLDVTSLRDSSQRERGLVLLQGASGEGTLSLGLLPPPPWGNDVELELRAGHVVDAATHAHVILE